MARYVQINEQEFRDFLEPKGFTVNESVPGNELVFEAEHDQGDAIIRIYSSVQRRGYGAGAGRKVGKDAIRVVLLARMPGNSSLTTLKPIFKGKRVHRVENWRENLRTRMNEAFEHIHENPCPECGAILVRREGKYGSFYSCVMWPVTKCQGKA